MSSRTARAARRSTTRRRDERGSLSPAIPVIAYVLLLLGGLVIDASRQLNARGQAVAFAQEAARAGAKAVRLDEFALDEPAARERVATYCARVEELDQVQTCEFVRVETTEGPDPRPLVVVVHVETLIDTTLLGLAGIDTLAASGDGRARPYEGVEAPGDVDDLPGGVPTLPAPPDLPTGGTP